MENEINLLPCPFCHGGAKVVKDYKTWDNTLYCGTYIECEVCGARTRGGYNTVYKDSPNARLVEAIELWNKRR